MAAPATKTNKPSPFGAIKALSETRPLTYTDLVEKQLPYETFLVNRAFSLSEDTALLAAILNERGFLDKDVQATFLIHSVKPRPRWNKWPKSMTDDTSKIVAEYYGWSVREAKLNAGLHTDAQIKEMKKFLATGAKRKRTQV